MKRLFFSLMLALSLFSSCGDGEHEPVVHEIICTAKYLGDPIGCYFYFFEPGEYVGVERDDFDLRDSGRAYAIKRDGTRVESIGYAFYFKKDARSKASYRKDRFGYIVEGTYYVACFPQFTGGRHFPYKAKTFTKQKYKGLFITPVFTKKSLALVDEYKYFDWDE